MMKAGSRYGYPVLRAPSILHHAADGIDLALNSPDSRYQLVPAVCTASRHTCLLLNASLSPGLLIRLVNSWQ
ncbi:hypothetical protein DGWBC_0569 [Dehalogenimonas sp. WBC-2]|nr:hypothetical protein DGWBC_0569 [Dehalogenimonas sp. WBC-2]